MQKQKLQIAGGLLVVLVALAAADAILVEGGLPSPEAAPEEPETTMEEKTPPEEQPMKGVRKQTGPDVLSILEEAGFEIAEEGEESILRRVVPEEDADVHTRILLKDNDRAGMISWLETPNVKILFLALKEALHSSFSPELQDLVDEKQQRQGKPPRELLTFLDPAISEERLAFVRVRDRLYELHIPAGMDDAIFGLIEELTK